MGDDADDKSEEQGHPVNGHVYFLLSDSELERRESAIHGNDEENCQDDDDD